MRRSSFITEKRKTTINNLKSSQNKEIQNKKRLTASQNQAIQYKKPSISNQYPSSQNQSNNDISKYNSLNREINKLIRTINMTFNFKTFKKEKLQLLEPVRTFF